MIYSERARRFRSHFAILSRVCRFNLSTILCLNIRFSENYIYIYTHTYGHTRTTTTTTITTTTTSNDDDDDDNDNNRPAPRQRGARSARRLFCRAPPWRLAARIKHMLTVMKILMLIIMMIIMII